MIYSNVNVLCAFQCQATWLYLEPIFSSEDIMRQMPQEASNFRKVDKAWRAIMANTVNDRHVLTATDYPNMLELLRENNVLLEEIQKGLNDYLEKKRLFFPRLVSSFQLLFHSVSYSLSNCLLSTCKPVEYLKFHA